MKKTIFICLVFLCLSICIKAQNEVEMDSINNLISLKVDKLDSIFKDCDTHYAMIKMEVDKNNKVLQVNSLNKIPAEFLAFFKPMKDYNFPKSKNRKKTILFIYVANSLNKCEPDKILVQKTIENLLPEITNLLAQQMKKNPKTFYEGLITSDFGMYGKK